MARQRSPENRAICDRLQKAFGARLHNARRNAARGRRNQDELAATLELTRTSVSNLERGNHRVFLDQVYLSARELGIDIADLLPPMSEVFPNRLVRPSPDFRPKERSKQELDDIARGIQQRAQEAQRVLERRPRSKPPGG